MNTLLRPLIAVEEAILCSKNLTRGSYGFENHSDAFSVAGGTSGGRSLSATLGILIQV